MIDVNNIDNICFDVTLLIYLILLSVDGTHVEWLKPDNE